MISWTDTGIVLSSRDHTEKYRLITIFTATHGKMTAMFSSSTPRGRFSIFSAVEIDYSSKSEISLGFWRLRSEKQNWVLSIHSQNHMLVCQSMCQLLNKVLPHGMPYERLFRVVQHIIENMQRFSETDVLLVYAYFEFILLHDIGFGVDLDNCASAFYKNENPSALELNALLPTNAAGQVHLLSRLQRLNAATTLVITGSILRHHLDGPESYFRTVVCQKAGCNTAHNVEIPGEKVA
ncbi:MAG: recombination protein O N-terminal domain-containing protein [Holosporales bacterium]|jgi:hypothetical protein|nr:recombination protein O N-terminal domain-containing protein [Holosporales bacterium]